MLSVSEKYNWHRLDPVDLDALRELKNQYHLALQNVAAVGRMFLGEEENDKNAVLNWVPGLWRLAGHWVTGEDTFRSSISFDDFSIYLVNEKIKTLASINLAGKKQNQVLVWLEQHIINLRLSSSHLIMNLPYELPSYPTQKGKPFADPDPELCRTLGGYFHDAFFLFAQMKETYDKTSDITIWPEHFNCNMQIILKETDEEATNTYITVGFSPGDEFYSEPYYYVRSWPFVSERRLTPLKTRGFWHDDDWIGAVYFVRNLWDCEDQKSIAMYFFNEAIPQLRSLLLN